MIIGNSGAGLEDLTVNIQSEGDRTHVDIGGLKYELKVPFSRAEVEKALDATSPNHSSTQSLPSLGSTLFSTLFSADLGRTLWQRMAEAESLDRGLRLRILSNSERVQHLPWELMFDPSRGDFMALSGRIALVRTRPEKYEQPKPLARLRILAAEADTTGGAMRTDEDVETLAQLAGMSGLVDLTILRGATQETLEQALGKDRFDVFHFAGSGEVQPFVSKRGGLRQTLRLIGPTSSEAQLDRHDLGKMLQRAGVRLAVLNACHSDWIARSVARYVHAVIGLREDAQVESCLLLCRSLYQSLLLQRMPLDLAVTAARQAMNLGARPGIADWCKLIFYLQQKDGTLLAPADSARPAAASLSAPPKSKEYAKLARLLDVHEANLDALTKGTGVGALNPPSELVTSLQEKIDEIKRQLGEA
ncbi:MAG TPA: CHAT domain-containing protein [Thermoanaerobaculia bacterium]|nr:CHAT domain-containing protein [Thermoanaerobaculia bacterium]